MTFLRGDVCKEVCRDVARSARGDLADGAGRICVGVPLREEDGREAYHSPLPEV